MEHQTPKIKFQNILLQIFELIETNVNEGVYLEVANCMKNINDELNNLLREGRNNSYYRNNIRTPRNNEYKRLTEEQKSRNEKYILCSCGRFILSKTLNKHLETQVHYLGIRNKKLTHLKDKECINKSIPILNGNAIPNISNEVRREILLEAFCINHHKLYINSIINSIINN